MLQSPKCEPNILVTTNLRSLTCSPIWVPDLSLECSRLLYSTLATCHLLTGCLPDISPTTTIRSIGIGTVPLDHEWRLHSNTLPNRHSMISSLIHMHTHKLCPPHSRFQFHLPSCFNVSISSLPSDFNVSNSQMTSTCFRA